MTAVGDIVSRDLMSVGDKLVSADAGNKESDPFGGKRPPLTPTYYIICCYHEAPGLIRLLSFQAMSRRETLTEKAQDEISSLADRNVDSTDTDLRYMAYGARLRTALRAGTRYIAYVRPPTSSTHICLW